MQLLILIFKDIDLKISEQNNSLSNTWKNEFKIPTPQLLEYRLAYLGTIFKMYQQEKIKQQEFLHLINIMYYEKFIRDDIVENIFLSRVDLDRKIYLQKII